MRFFSKKKTYSKYYPKGKREIPRGRGTSSINNPALNMYLNLAKSCRNWQLAFLIMAGFFGVSLFSYFQLANRTKLVPFIIEIDQEGKPHFAGKMEQIQFKANDVLIFSMLDTHIMNSRSVSLDRVITYKLLKKQYSFLSKEMKNKMNEEITTLNIEKKFKTKESIDVQITSILKNSEGVYQVNWIEKKFKDGSFVESKKMTGLFSVSQKTGTLSEEELRNNPLELIIEDYNITIDKSI
ncbi:VirB8 protein [Fusobacterium necrophorum subsp. funduliforme ATCC 51357]|uniref:Conjugal transfer protein n=1 Tax=Fusobacterium gonidiaformans 3-1-5R TaxID=469605 RepID=E5BI41_9FUSO|nr:MULTISPECIES: type IV secretion system protein [Fusobacterium]EFS22164.1 conjugal transfer protein [Fusobacterium gonidiaformans 3-1-5R]EIJ68688.1 VirB8 protein [Fusobacterium necrophorum subsp. funduliforme ATCC 51357]KAB0552953.1 type IV secretion system protein [Fusobacterium necrophorum subsp. funduliforme]